MRRTRRSTRTGIALLALSGLLVASASPAPAATQQPAELQGGQLGCEPELDDEVLLAGRAGSARRCGAATAPDASARRVMLPPGRAHPARSPPANG